MAETPRALLLSDDLLDGSRVTGSARATGVEVRQLRSTDAVLSAAREHAPGCILVDLHIPGLDIASLIGGIAPLSARPRVVAFGSHVDAARLRTARQAGCDLVMPRSQFFEELEGKLLDWASASDNANEER